MKYEEFDQYLMLGENNELKNRYQLISAPEEFTPQVDPWDDFCQKLILAIGNDSCSVKTIMEKLQLSDRKNFLDNYLNPAIKDGFVRLLYPDSLRHPPDKNIFWRQKELLYIRN